MRRIPSGAMQKFYKRLYDLWKRYPDRWVNEKGYADADYFHHKMAKLLKDVSAALKGQPIPGTFPEERAAGHRFRTRMDFPDFEQEPYGGVPQEYASVPRHIRMTPQRTHFAPRTTVPVRSSAQSRSRSVRPSFMRRGKSFKRKSR